MKTARAARRRFGALCTGVQRRRAAAGFTLMEVLMAIVLLALLLGLAYGAFRTTAASVSRGEALIDRTERVRVAQQFLRRQLSFSLPMMFERVDQGGLDNKVFEGDASRMRFVAPMPGYLAKGGAHVQTLSLVSDAGGLRLEFEHELLNGYEYGQPARDARPPVQLLHGARAGGFQYRGMDAEGELEEWQDRWQDPTRLPLMVRLELEWPDEAQMRWPPLEVPLMRAVAVPGLGASGMLGNPGFAPMSPGLQRPGATRPNRPTRPDQ